jgi:hypothetical protein
MSDLTFEKQPFKRIISLHELHTLICSKHGEVCEQTLQNIDQHCNKKTTESDDMPAIDKGINRMLSSVGVDSIQRLDKIIRRLSDCVTLKGDVQFDYIALLYLIKLNLFQDSFMTLIKRRNSHEKQLINAKFTKGFHEEFFQVVLPLVPSCDSSFFDMRPLQENINHAFDVFSNSRVNRYKWYATGIMGQK